MELTKVEIENNFSLNTGQAEIKYPYHVYPKQIQEIVEATNKYLNFPIEYISSSILYTVSVAVGNTTHIEIKKGYRQTSVLYLALVGRAGVNKTHPLTFALKPIQKNDSETYSTYRRNLDEFNTIAGMSKKEKRVLNITDVKKKPAWKKFIISDFTPEALAQAHQINSRSLGVYVDELKGWINNFNRYNTGSEEQFWLSNWNSTAINIDRKTTESLLIKSPFISVIGTIQTKVLKSFAGKERTDNGFIERMLFVIPDNMKKEYLNETEINQIHIDNWNNAINKLLEIKLNNNTYDDIEPTLLKFTPEAKKLFFEYQKKLTDKSNNPKNENIAGIFSKLEMQTARFSLILEMMYYSVGESDKTAISERAVKGAIELSKYFETQLIKAISIINNEDPLQFITKDKIMLYKNLPQEFELKQGIEIAEKFEIKEISFKRFVKNETLFCRLKHGYYGKNY